MKANTCKTGDNPFKYDRSRYPSLDRVSGGLESIWTNVGSPFRGLVMPLGWRGWMESDWLSYTLYIMDDERYE